MAGKIILVNGASSSGKTTLCKALQDALEEPFWHYSIDHFRSAGVLPDARMRSGEFAWQELREPFFEGFHRCLPALAEAGNNLIVEHIVESQAWMDRLVGLLDGFDVFYVGLHAPLEVLEERELARGDRRIGEAREDLGHIHAYGIYDLELDSTVPVDQNVALLLKAWQARSRPTAFERMRA